MVPNGCLDTLLWHLLQVPTLSLCRCQGALQTASHCSHFSGYLSVQVRIVAFFTKTKKLLNFKQLNSILCCRTSFSTPMAITIDTTVFAKACCEKWASSTCHLYFLTSPNITNFYVWLLWQWYHWKLFPWGHLQITPWHNISPIDFLNFMSSGSHLSPFFPSLW